MKHGTSRFHAILASLLACPAAAQVTQRVSVNSSGVQQNHGCGSSSISPDGRFIAFASTGSNLDPVDTDQGTDVFVRDRVLGTTECVSLSSSGGHAFTGGDYPSISADGRMVVFRSQGRLTPNDQNFDFDIYVRDRLLGTTVCVSVDMNGFAAGANGGTISSDGRYAGFWSDASTIVPGDTNHVGDVFVRDLLNGVTTRVSVSWTGAEADNASDSPCISRDGRCVAFASYATNLVSGSTLNRNIFLYDLQTGTIDWISRTWTGGQANGNSYMPFVTEDGRFVAFSSEASNLVPGDGNGTVDAFLFDRQTGILERTSLTGSGTETNGASLAGPVSEDGRFSVFESDGDTLVPDDKNGDRDIFVKDRRTGATERVSVGFDGVEGDRLSTYPSMTSDGRLIVFTSLADNLVPGDRNSFTDIFLRDRTGGTSFTSLCEPGSNGVIPCPCSNSPGGPGRGCDNSGATGGAILEASGGAFVSSDTVEFHCSGEPSSALSLLVQGSMEMPQGSILGQGVLCIGAPLTRLLSKHAVGGRCLLPDLVLGEPTISAVSNAKGAPILSGQSRCYAVLYRDPLVLGACSPQSTFNCTQTGRIAWSP